MAGREPHAVAYTVQNWFSGTNGKNFRGDEVCAAGFVDVMDTDEGLPRSLLIATSLTAGLQMGFIAKALDSPAIRKACSDRLRGKKSNYRTASRPKPIRRPLISNLPPFPRLRSLGFLPRDRHFTVQNLSSTALLGEATFPVATFYSTCRNTIWAEQLPSIDTNDCTATTWRPNSVILRG